jgi:hypothetical protein
MGVEAVDNQTIIAYISTVEIVDRVGIGLLQYISRKFRGLGFSALFSGIFEETSA